MFLSVVSSLHHFEKSQTLSVLGEVENSGGETMKLATIALAFAFALSSTFALAKTVRQKPGIATHDLHRGTPLGRSGFLHPNSGNPDGSVSAGGVMWNGRSASEWGGG